MNSGQLGMCNDPYCTTCPGAYRASIHADATGRGRKRFQFLSSKFIMNPHNEHVQRWNKFFVISCLVAVFIDPLFFFILSVNEDYKCIFYDWSFAIGIAVVRTVTDIVFLLHILLQFRLAYVAPESRVSGTGDFVVEPKKIAVHYLRGYFLPDLFAALPLPQVIILLVMPTYWGSSAANYAKNMLRAAVLLQYVPRITRVLPLIAGGYSTAFIFESAWTNFVINLLMFVLAGHVMGSCWYLFGLQRVNRCLQDACLASKITNCKVFLDCGRGPKYHNFTGNPDWEIWNKDAEASSCLSKSNTYSYGIYQQASIITKRDSFIVRYIYSLFWGFQVLFYPFIWHILFTMGIIGLGLLLFALLIGNMQNFLQSLGKRTLEMQLRRHDVGQWMSHRHLPRHLQSQVKKAEKFSWAATRGVNEEELLKNLPEDLQRDIRRHLFGFLKEVRIFSLMDEPILDAFRGILRQELYMDKSYVQNKGGPIGKMVFIVRGQMESIGSDGNPSLLREGDVCGEELLAWHLENVSVKKETEKIRGPKQRLFSNRDVRCTSNVEAFILQSSDLVDVIINFERFLRNPRTKAATHIQVVWKYHRWQRMRKAKAHNQGRHPMDAAFLLGTERGFITITGLTQRSGVVMLCFTISSSEGVDFC
ncbi:unnamed protein product [Spirodela intermedia]|uniref:Ion transport domain-containing protein n=1 Tax=Spirodela intermedia TaxID=51605 RepID=A0A7I8IQS0_SPIIN|nr:unnamed protein product [Spirodela intermedia]CAA6659350.1 unnamed protein product [Spirodela intermedia]